MLQLKQVVLAQHSQLANMSTMEAQASSLAGKGSNGAEKPKNRCKKPHLQNLDLAKKRFW
jgi:hypothetical protein